MFKIRIGGFSEDVLQASCMDDRIAFLVSYLILLPGSTESGTGHA